MKQKKIHFALIILLSTLSFSLMAQPEINGENYTNGKNKFNSKDFNGAIIDFTKYISANSNSQNILTADNVNNAIFMIGYSYFSIGSFVSADGSFNNLIERSAVSKRMIYQAYKYKGLMKYFEKSYLEAITLFTSAIESYKKDYYVHLMRGICYLKVSKNADALNDFNYVIEEKNATNEKVYASYFSGKVETALLLIKDLLNDKPTDVTYYDIACLSSLRESKSEALTNLELALKNGYSNQLFLYKDPNLDYIRSTSEFNELLEKYSIKKPDYYYKNVVVSIEEDIQKVIDNAESHTVLNFPEKVYLLEGALKISNKEYLILNFSKSSAIFTLNLNQPVVRISDSKNISINNGLFKHVKKGTYSACSGQVFVIEGKSSLINLDGCNINGCGTIGVAGYVSQITNCNIHDNTLAAVDLWDGNVVMKNVNVFNNGSTGTDVFNLYEGSPKLKLTTTNITKIKNPWMGYSDKEKQFLIDTEKKIVDSLNIYDINYTFKGKLINGLAIVNTGGKFYNKSNVYLGGKYGYVDFNNKVIIPLIYDYASDFENGLALVNKGRKISISDSSKFETNGLFGIIDSTGKEVVPIIYQFLDFYDKTIYDSVNNPNQYIFLATKDMKCGWIDNNGNIIIPLIYDDAEHEYTGNLFRVKKGNKWGYIDIYGNEIIPFIYDKVGRFKNGQTSRCIKDGQEVIVDLPVDLIKAKSKLNNNSVEKSNSKKDLCFTYSDPKNPENIDIINMTIQGTTVSGTRSGEVHTGTTNWTYEGIFNGTINNNTISVTEKTAVEGDEQTNTLEFILVNDELLKYGNTNFSSCKKKNNQNCNLQISNSYTDFWADAESGDMGGNASIIFTKLPDGNYEAQIEQRYGTEGGIYPKQRVKNLFIDDKCNITFEVIWFTDTLGDKTKTKTVKAIGSITKSDLKFNIDIPGSQEYLLH